MITNLINNFEDICRDLNNEIVIEYYKEKISGVTELFFKIKFIDKFKIILLNF